MSECVKPYDRLEHTKIIHQLNQCDKGNQRHQVWNNNVTYALPATGTVNHCRFKRVLWHSLQTRIKDNKSKWRSMPDAIHYQRHPGK